MKYFVRLPLAEGFEERLLEKKTKKFSLNDHERAEISSKLLASQKFICAYCESRIRKGNFHVEHFEEQHDKPERRYDYQNFVLSCEGNTKPTKRPESSYEKIIRRANMSCGHQKTKSGHQNEEIDYSLLLNPTENVAHLFSYRDGIAEPSEQCTARQRLQVEYTIQRLRLDAKRLENARINELTNIAAQLADLDSADKKRFMRFLLDETQAELNPFYSTVKDNFGYLI